MCIHTSALKPRHYTAKYNVQFSHANVLTLFVSAVSVLSDEVGPGSTNINSVPVHFQFMFCVFGMFQTLVTHVTLSLDGKIYKV